MTLRLKRTAAALGLAATAVLATACAATGDDAATEAVPASASHEVNPATLDQTADAVAKSGLPVTNRRDATSQVCPQAGCQAALATDQFTILQFATTGRAQVYAGENPDAFELLDVAVTFPSTADAAARTRYQDAIQRAIA